jgi:outer membrane murein-binding lipoprotein Lpp
MSEDLTKEIGEKYQTNPTIETVLERINALGEGLNARIDALGEGLNARMDKIEARLGGLEEKVVKLEENMNKRFDSVESRLHDMTIKVKLLNQDVLQMRADIEGMGERVERMESHFKEKEPEEVR